MVNMCAVILSIAESVKNVLFRQQRIVSFPTVTPTVLNNLQINCLDGNGESRNVLEKLSTGI